MRSQSRAAVLLQGPAGLDAAAAGGCSCWDSVVLLNMVWWPQHLPLGVSYGTVCVCMCMCITRQWCCCG